MTETLAPPLTPLAPGPYLHDAIPVPTVVDLRDHYDANKELYAPLEPHAGNFLTRKEQEQLTAEQVRQDSLDRLRTPKAERKGSEVQDQFTGEARKPCFELEIDDTSKTEVAEVLGKRSEGLAVVHSLLDRLPPIKSSCLEAGSLPLIGTLQPYVDKAESVYNEWQADKETHRVKQAEADKAHDFSSDPFGQPVAPRPKRPDIELEDVSYTWQPQIKENAPRYQEQSADELVEGIVEEYQEFADWRSGIAVDLDANRKLVADGAWPGEKMLEEIAAEADRRVVYTQGTKQELVRSLLATHLANKIGLQTDRNEGQILRSQDTWAKTVGTKVREGLLPSLGLTPVSYESEGTHRAGTLADAYLSPEDVVVYDAMADRLDDMFGEPGVTMPGESLKLRPGYLADRLTDFAAQLIPEGTSLIHTTHVDRLEDLLRSGALKSRTASGSKESVMGDHSNYVHFAEPGKVNYYGAILVAVPIEEVIAKTPYHQAETRYKKGLGALNTQEKFGAINVNPSQLPLAARLRLTELNERFDSGLVEENTQGNHNNISFAASSNREAAGEYGYDAATLKVICNPDNAGRIRNFVPGNQLVIANESGRNFGHSVGTAGYRLESPVDLSRRSITLFGPLTQRRVDFSEEDLRSKSAQKSFTSLARQREIEAEETRLRNWAERTLIEAEAAGLSVEAYEAQHDVAMRQKVDDMFSGEEPFEIPMAGVSF